MGWTSGVVIATQVIIEGADAGMFLYSGPGGLGDLIASITAVSGPDAFGNPTHAIASFGNQSGAYLNIGTAGDLTVTNASSKVVLQARASDGSLFQYSATGGAGAGNLLTAVTPAATTDNFTNAVPAGVTSFGGGGSFANLQQGVLSFQGGASQFSPALVWTSGLPGLLELSSGESTGGDSPTLLDLLSGAQSGVGHSQLLVNAHETVFSGNATFTSAANITASTSTINIANGFINLNMAIPTNFPTAGKTLAQTQAALDALITSMQNRQLIA